MNVLLLLLVLHIFSMQSGHSRLVGIVCKNPRCRKTFESLHAYNQHRRHPSNKGTQCSSLLCMGEIVVDTRRNVGTAILRREDSPAMQGIGMRVRLHVLFRKQGSANHNTSEGCSTRRTVQSVQLEAHARGPVRTVQSVQHRKLVSLACDSDPVRLGSAAHGHGV